MHANKCIMWLLTTKEAIHNFQKESSGQISQNESSGYHFSYILWCVQKWIKKILRIKSHEKFTSLRTSPQDKFLTKSPQDITFHTFSDASRNELKKSSGLRVMKNSQVSERVLRTNFSQRVLRTNFSQRVLRTNFSQRVLRISLFIHSLMRPEIN